MLDSLLGSRRRRACLLAYAVVAITLAAGVSELGSGEYCRYCGLTRHETRVLWFGFPLQQRVRYGDNTFHQLYARFVTAHCRHHWRRYTIRDWEPLWLRGGVGCGHVPTVLLDLHEEDLILLPRLRDPSKAAAVLASFDLTRDSSREDAIIAALAKLRQVSSAAEENRWWARHRQLFRSRGEDRRAAHRNAACPA
jgi:hypothetical protein